MSLKLNPKALISAFTKEFAPKFLIGILKEQSKDKTVAQFYSYIEGGIWNSIPQGQRQFLLNQRPWDLTWLNLDFIVKAIAQSNKKIAFLIISSPEMQAKIAGEIDDIKRQLA